MSACPSLLTSLYSLSWKTLFLSLYPFFFRHEVQLNTTWHSLDRTTLYVWEHVVVEHYMLNIGGELYSVVTTNSGLLWTSTTSNKIVALHDARQQRHVFVGSTRHGVMASISCDTRWCRRMHRPHNCGMRLAHAKCVVILTKVTCYPCKWHPLW